MSTTELSGADAIVTVLQECGVTTVFGVPGTQNIPIYDALRRSDINTVLATSETMAGFMAIGWFRATGQPGVFLAIPGPGFAFALPALAEASLDSSSLLLITGHQESRGRLFDHQAIDQDAIAAAICRDHRTARTAAEIPQQLSRALSATIDRGRGPVVLQVAASALTETCSVSQPTMQRTQAKSVSAPVPDDLTAKLNDCERPLLLLGAGALESPEEVDTFARSMKALIVTTPSARGLVLEADPVVIPADLLCDDHAEFNALLERSDLILALGVRFSHNSTGGFSMRLPEDRLVHVYDDPSILNVNYRARWSVAASVGDFISAATHGLDIERQTSRSDWLSSATEWRNRILSRAPDPDYEPVWAATGHSGCQGILEAIRGAVPDDAILVTDTGLHQIYTRKYFEVRAPRGLIMPTDFQSMGFGLPAAIGAALAEPTRRVVALVGDGTLQMTISELVTIAREQIPVLVIVFSDGWLGQIRMQQIAWGSEEFSTELPKIDLKNICQAVQVRYEKGMDDLRSQVSSLLDTQTSALLEIELSDPAHLNQIKAKSRRKEAVKRLIGPSTIRVMKKLLNRARPSSGD